ncbi:MAG: N-acetylmuramoyl-L-alanine amidase [Anaerolineae bacterium]|nr:N-acetylmuramoyl-L-alanine amidase [Anaerolineae bacterium]
MMPPPRNDQLSRRAVLGILGLGGLVGLAGAGGMLGLILLKNARRAAQTPPTPTPDPRPPFIARADWGALPPDHSAANETGFYSAENPEGWRVYDGTLADDSNSLQDVYRTVVIHHSANYGADDLDTLLYIQERHRGERGWADVGYHFFVGKTGVIYEGRALNVRGAHVAGHNTGSVGVCLLGNYEEQTPPVEQLAATVVLTGWLAETLALTHLAGHREFNADTVCPGANLFPHLDMLAQAAGLARGTGGYAPSEEQIRATETAAASP